MAMKVGLLGAGFGQAHAAIYAAHPGVDEVVVFGRTPEKLSKISDTYGFATMRLTLDIQHRLDQQHFV
jgi:predicted dehydrogenase